MKKKNIVFLSVFLFLIIIISTVSYAKNTDIEKISEKIQISEEHKIWEKLSESEKKDLIEPLPFKIDLKDSIKRSTFNSILRGSTDIQIENKFDLREKLNGNINVKNQKRVGSCWAFSFTSVLETTMANKKQITGLNYSPMHIDYKTGEIYNRKIGEGGNIYLSLAYSASGNGPVYEDDFKFSDVYNEQTNSAENYYLSDISEVDLNKNPRAIVKDARIFASIYKQFETSETTGKTEITYKDSSPTTMNEKIYTIDEVNLIRNMIKKHIKEDGAVTGTFYVDSGIQYGGNSNYFNPSTNAYYYPSSSNLANHAVTIVGWDDNYSKDNFNSENKPENDGAYIVLNSWGEQWGDNGYYYVSYDDGAIEQLICGVREIEEVDSSIEENVYEYDPLGMTTMIVSVNDEATQLLGSGYAANVFNKENENGKNEYLSEVGIFLYKTEGIEIYVNPNDGDLSKGELVASYTGSNALEAGYHRVKLASPILLNGTKFAIKVKYINSEMTTIPIECNIVSSGMVTGSSLYDKAKANLGESFISNDGVNWTDINNYSYVGVNFKDTNVCIKGFTVLSSGTSDPIDEPDSEVAVTGVELNESERTIKIGETVSLIATVKPENATNKNISWISGNEEIATVVNGIVTGVSAGTTTITVKTEDGNHTDTFSITVEREETQSKAVTGVELNKTSGTIKVGETMSLIAIVKPENATNKNISWISGDEKIATVLNGVVTGVSAGTTTITVKTEDGNFMDICNIIVEANDEEQIKHVENITLEKNKCTIEEGQTLTIAALIYPLDATNKKVIWSSSDESIATVTPEGIITALKTGKVTITVTTLDGNLKATAELTVTAKTNADDDIYIEDLTNNTNENTNISEQNSTTIEQYSIKEENASGSPSVLPYTGAKSVLLICIGIVSVTIVFCYKKYNKMKDIK